MSEIQWVFFYISLNKYNTHIIFSNVLLFMAVCLSVWLCLSLTVSVSID